MAGYHHGDLRRALLDAAAAEIAEHGPSAISLRAIARRAGVSHAAPAHHFGDRAGLLTAVAAEGFRRMNETMVAAAGSSTEPLLALGWAYVAFARDNPGEFAVMFRPELLDGSDPDLVTTSASAYQRLSDAIATTPDAACEGEEPGVTAARHWALVHGLATLIITGSLPTDDDFIYSVLAGG
ncbi:MAG: TetR/AcrR family transcriptional regulator [Acidimicrobiales bacterium]|nr:TetR/AcrR family transcriptional regulator [Acidimicrobiales bacterium]